MLSRIGWNVAPRNTGQKGMFRTIDILAQVLFGHGQNDKTKFIQEVNCNESSLTSLATHLPFK